MKINENKINYDLVFPLFEVQKEIPKRINQIYIAPGKCPKGEELPIALLEKIYSTRKLNPNYKYKLWFSDDIEDFIKSTYGEIIWKYYDRVSSKYPAVKADLFRYLLIYKEGGIYFDLKITFSKSFDECLLPNDEYILSHWDNYTGGTHEGWGTLFPELSHIHRGEYIMGVIVAAPGHPFLRAVILQVLRNIESYDPYLHDVGWGGALAIGGPICYTLIITKLQREMNIKNYREVDIVPDFGLEYSYKNTKLVKADYRKEYAPVVKHDSKVKQIFNLSYFFLLSFYRQVRLRFLSSNKKVSE
ncbi:hypothetical protein NXW86_08615 [Bacteroides thetaiotaomicron]|uniref:glycosyltransferase family 32 protein n=1 Tax=Bacteroides thetaiotaomicron TaxID=818 RepID=UPI00216634FE|nr:glycosyltransferase [Bacteroides thetaiotaomicron]MCS2449215.1 hypothetical protein [Bacteroides thetaiotaomicron]